jgi:hypothetical protein
LFEVLDCPGITGEKGLPRLSVAATTCSGPFSLSPSTQYLLEWNAAAHHFVHERMRGANRYTRIVASVEDCLFVWCRGLLPAALVALVSAYARPWEFACERLVPRRRLVNPRMTSGVDTRRHRRDEQAVCAVVG